MKTKHFVRQSLFLVWLFLFTDQGLRDPALAELLPSIDARQLEIIPKEISRSGRVYRFQLGGEIPRTGNILLIQVGDRPIMAFRVLKTDSGSKEIIAKRIRRYDHEGRLELEKKYLAAEKIADLVSPPEGKPEAKPDAPEMAARPIPVPPVTPQTAPEPTLAVEPESSKTEEKTEEKNDTVETQVKNEQEETPKREAPDPNAPALLGDDGSGGPKSQTPIVPGSVESYDEDLDATTSPKDFKSDDGFSDLGVEGSNKSGPGVEEHEPVIQFNHMAGLSVGSFMNMSGFVIPGTSHNGFTTYYNEIIDRELWFKEHAPQDSLSLEFGLGYYSRVNLSGTFDNYDVIPIRSELLYTLQFNPTIALLAHVGAQFNWVISAENATESGLSTLEGIQPNAGVGLLYNIGPQWYLRADLGLDRLAIGLAVKW